MQEKNWNCHCVVCSKIIDCFMVRHNNVHDEKTRLNLLYEWGFVMQNTEFRTLITDLPGSVHNLSLLIYNRCRPKQVNWNHEQWAACVKLWGRGRLVASIHALPARIGLAQYVEWNLPGFPVLILGRHLQSLTTLHRLENGYNALSWARWPSGLERWLALATGRCETGSNPTADNFALELWQFRLPRLASVFRRRH